MPPPPLPPEARRSAEKTFSHVAAMASCVTPVLIIAIALIGGVSSILQLDIANARHLIPFAVIALLMVLGLILGIVGLCGVANLGRKGLFAPALTGTVLNGAVACVLAYAVVLQVTAHLQNQIKARTELEQLQKDARNDFGITNQAMSEKKLDGYKKSLQSVAQNLTGDDALAVHASAEYISEISDLRKEVDASSAELASTRVLTARTVTNVDQFETRKKMVQRYLDANDKLKDFFQHNADRYNEAMVRWHVPAARAAVELRAFKSKGGVINALVVEQRECENRVGHDMLSVLDLEETNWGQWHVDKNTGKLVFADDTVRQRYNAVMSDIRLDAAEAKKVAASLAAAKQAAR